jgi:hypothetical protein
MFKTIDHNDHGRFTRKAFPFALGGVLALFVFGLTLMMA